MASAARYLLEHQVKPALAFETWDAPVERVRDALEQRERIAAFAVVAQGLQPDALLSEYRKLCR